MRTRLWFKKYWAAKGNQTAYNASQLSIALGHQKASNKSDFSKAAEKSAHMNSNWTLAAKTSNFAMIMQFSSEQNTIWQVFFAKTCPRDELLQNNGPIWTVSNNGLDVATDGELTLERKLFQVRCKIFLEKPVLYQIFSCQKNFCPSERLNRLEVVLRTCFYDRFGSL